MSEGGQGYGFSVQGLGFGYRIEWSCHRGGNAFDLSSTPSVVSPSFATGTPYARIPDASPRPNLKQPE